MATGARPRPSSADSFSPRLFTFIAGSSGRTGADGEAHTHLVADGIDDGIVAHAVVASIHDELTARGQGNVRHRDVDGHGDLARDTSHREEAGDGRAATCRLDAQALERDGGEALDVEEVGAPEVRVAEADARVDRRRIDRQVDPRGREVLRIDGDVAPEAMEAPVGVHEARRRPESELARLRLDGVPARVRRRERDGERDGDERDDRRQDAPRWRGRTAGDAGPEAHGPQYASVVDLV